VNPRALDILGWLLVLVAAIWMFANVRSVGMSFPNGPWLLSGFVSLAWAVVNVFLFRVLHRPHVRALFHSTAPLSASPVQA
jgi:hypothetical protein